MGSRFGVKNMEGGMGNPRHQSLRWWNLPTMPSSMWECSVLNLCLPDFLCLKWWDYLLQCCLCAANMWWWWTSLPGNYEYDGCSLLLRAARSKRAEPILEGRHKSQESFCCIIAVGSCLNRLTVSFIVYPAFLWWLKTYIYNFICDIFPGCLFCTEMYFS